MMLLPNTKRLMFGYLLGAYTTSITLGLLIVFSLQRLRQRRNVAADAGAGRGPRRRRCSPCSSPTPSAAGGPSRCASAAGGARRRRSASPDRPSPGRSGCWAAARPRITFAVGVVLTFPGVSYLTALDRMAKLDVSDARHGPARPRLLPDPAAAARGPAARLRVRAGADPARRHRLPRVARPQRAPRGDDRRRRGRRAADRPRRDRAAGLAGVTGGTCRRGPLNGPARRP